MYNASVQYIPINILQDNKEEEEEEKQSLLNYKPRIVVIGSSGAGKSSLLNLLADQQDLFESGQGIEGVTKQESTKLRKIKLLTDSYEVQLIDTIGMYELSQYKQKSIPNLCNFLYGLKRISALLIVSANERLQKRTVITLRILSKLFGFDFLKVSIFVRTKWGFRRKDIKKRTKTQLQIEAQINDSLRKFRILPARKSIPAVFIDSYYVDPEELSDLFPKGQEVFKVQFDKLKHFLQRYVTEDPIPFQFMIFEKIKKFFNPYQRQSKIQFIQKVAQRAPIYSKYCIIQENYANRLAKQAVPDLKNELKKLIIQQSKYSFMKHLQDDFQNLDIDLPLNNHLPQKLNDIRYKNVGIKLILLLGFICTIFTVIWKMNQDEFYRSVKTSELGLIDKAEAFFKFLTMDIIIEDVYRTSTIFIFLAWFVGYYVISFVSWSKKETNSQLAIAIYNDIQLNKRNIVDQLQIFCHNSLTLLMHQMELETQQSQQSQQ